MIKTVTQQRFENLATSPEFISKYNQAMSLLHDIAFFDVLQSANRPTVAGGDLTQVAIQAAKQSGFADCMDTIQNFRAMFLTLPNEPRAEMHPDYGAIDKLVANKEITEEEAVKLREKKRQNIKAVK